MYWFKVNHSVWYSSRVTESFNTPVQTAENMRELLGKVIDIERGLKAAGYIEVPEFNQQDDDKRDWTWHFVNESLGMTVRAVILVWER